MHRYNTNSLKSIRMNLRTKSKLLC